MQQDRFKGGDHTHEKIKTVFAYASFFTSALRSQPFQLSYIDAFAGSGTYSFDAGDAGWLAEFVDEQGIVSKPGSARKVLDIDPAFNEIIYIENDRKSVEALHALKVQFPERNIRILEEDANEAVQRLCRKTNWRKNRAVMFLDPFAMTVDFDTLIEIGKTQAIDLWYLFPTNAVNRQLSHNINAIDDGKVNALNRVLGGDWWKAEFYKIERPSTGDLFSNEESEVHKREAGLVKVEQAFIRRLSEHFGYVAPKPRRLYRQGQQLFSLIFAVANKNKIAWGLAKKVTDHILR